MDDHGKCRILRNLFCFVCAKFTPLIKSQEITPATLIHYNNVYKVGITQEFLTDWYIPPRICSTCRWNLFRKRPQDATIVSPAVWSKPSGQENCYFCQTNRPVGKNVSPKFHVSSVRLPVIREKPNGRPIDLRKRLVSTLDDNENSNEKPRKKKLQTIPPLWTKDDAYDDIVDKNYQPPPTKRDCA